LTAFEAADKLEGYLCWCGDYGKHSRHTAGWEHQGRSERDDGVRHCEGNFAAACGCGVCGKNLFEQRATGFVRRSGGGPRLFGGFAAAAEKKRKTEDFAGQGRGCAVRFSPFGGTFAGRGGEGALSECKTRHGPAGGERFLLRVLA